MIPAIQSKCLTANDNSGVGRKDSKINALIPLAARVRAASSANSGDICLESNAIATRFLSVPCSKI